MIILETRFYDNYIFYIDFMGNDRGSGCVMGWGLWETHSKLFLIRSALIRGVMDSLEKTMYAANIPLIPSLTITHDNKLH